MSDELCRFKEEEGERQVVSSAIRVMRIRHLLSIPTVRV